MNKVRRVGLCAASAVCALLLSGCNFSTPALATPDAGADASIVGPLDASLSGDVGAPEDAASDTAVDTGRGGGSGDGGGSDSGGTGFADVGTADAGSPDTATTPPDPPAQYEADLTYATANIGRDYNTKADVQAVFDRVGDVLGPRPRPKFIGWQEIGEADPCGSTCEIDAIHNRFKSQWGWTTFRPRATRPDGHRELVKEPITSKGVNSNISARAVFASPGWAHVSPTRFVTVAHYGPRNLSVVNTHLIAGAWSCKSQVAKRRDYWRRGWRVLKAEVAKEHDHGYNVIVTGDLNRPRQQNNCNPAWDPTSLHPRAKIIAGAGIDYVFAVPAAGYDFAVSHRADGTAKRGTIRLGIDGHKAHWVGGRFLHR